MPGVNRDVPRSQVKASVGDRKAALEKLLEKSKPPVLYSEHLAADGAAMLRYACHLKLEGIVPNVSMADTSQPFFQLVESNVSETGNAGCRRYLVQRLEVRRHISGPGRRWRADLRRQGRERYQHRTTEGHHLALQNAFNAAPSTQARSQKTKGAMAQADAPGRRGIPGTYWRWKTP